MQEFTDKELIRTRLRFIDIIKSFFISPPDSERFSRWRGTFAALSRESITKEMDSPTGVLASLISSKKLEDFADEYYALFTDPFSETPLNLTASHHLDGRNQGESLIAVRQLIHDADIGVDPAVKLPEDSLPVMMDILATLIEQEAGGIDTRPFQEKTHKRSASSIDKSHGQRGRRQFNRRILPCVPEILLCIYQSRKKPDRLMAAGTVGSRILEYPAASSPNHSSLHRV